MALLAIIFSLILEKFIYSIDRIRRIDWFFNFTGFVHTKMADLKYWNDTLSVLLIILLPVFITAYIQYKLDEIFILFSFAFSILLLVVCIGPKDSQQTAHLYLNARERGDEASALALAQEILNATPPEDHSVMVREINKIIFIDANERLFAVLFWFVLLGPIGALLFRLTSALRTFIHQNPTTIRAEFENASRLLYFLLNWIPARLTALSYAVVGSFVDAFQQWKNHQSTQPMDPEECDKLLINAGFGALRINVDAADFNDKSIHDVLSLTRRSFFVWLTILAISTLAGWAS